ncbi:hypothetical protein A7U60_g600 [Sanghuangporus baumii]|uniref:Uncharacterized protein n=1 Tax=Sanghuangporus baumii TaxID=108892 RepID=A0A9Q5I5H9_SANBA|nr:hypothetical protein A7U60_g600 [Sanghuangporus baumii]
MDRDSDGYPSSPLSRRAGVQTPSWVTFREEERASNTVLCFPFKPLRDVRLSRKDKFEMREPTTTRPVAVDPIEAYKTKVKLLETELERLNKKLEDLRRDYSRLYTRAQHSDARCTDARWKFKRLREAYEDLARVTYETYGKEEFRALKEKVEADKQQVARKRFLASQTMLVINTDDTDTESAAH